MVYPVECTHSGYDGCKDAPHVHWLLHGACSTPTSPVHRCPGVRTTYGGRKTINCPCDCHRRTTLRTMREIGDERTAGDILPITPRPV